jgi:hypothetical protein
MSASKAWLEARRPTPPPDLAAALSLEERPGALVDGLAAEGIARLHMARARLGRERASAFRLLEADALVTYACEAALEGDDPEGALRRILVSTSV